MRKDVSRLLGLISLLFISSQTFAAFPPPEGWYVEANGGYSQVTSKSYSSVSAKRTGFGWNIDLGYKITTYFGVEGGYTHYFQSRLSANGTSVGTDTHYSYDLAAKATLPISDSSVEGFAKLGIARVNSNQRITNQAQAGSLVAGTKNVTGLYMALGLDYYFAPNIAAIIQWARAHGNSQTGDLNLYSLGISYNFG